jgi:16S rRNA (guanine527-N7)-methyltransferase
MKEINRYLPELTGDKAEKLSRLTSFYREWNQRINLISRKDIDLINERHILHSLTLVKYFPFAENTTVIDIGTGGGFPGIPLAIYFNNVSFTLVDSIGKKIHVVNQITQALELKNINAIHGRAEKLSQQYDFITSRAVTQYPKFISMFSHLIKQDGINDFQNGILYYKGGDLNDELGTYLGRTDIIDLKEDFTEPYFETKRLIYLPISKFS